MVVNVKERNMKRKNVADNIPVVGISLDVTNNCNLNCDYCYKGQKEEERLSWEIGIKAINFLIQHSQDQKKLRVTFFGGEPLLEFNLIEKLVHYAEQKAAYYNKRIQFRVTTNCVLVNDEIIRFSQQHGIVFNISIDGGPESQDKHRYFPDGSGTSAVIEPKIKKILKYWPNTLVHVSLSSDIAYKWMQDTLYLVALGCKNICVTPIPECAWTKEQLKCLQYELRKIADFYIERFRLGNPIFFEPFERTVMRVAMPLRPKSSCGVGIRTLAVKTDGTIYPCNRFGPHSVFGQAADSNISNQYQLGSIYDGIDREKRRVFLNFDSVAQAKTDCENCLAVHICGHECIAPRWVCFGDIYKPHPNQCKFNNMYFKEALRIHYILESEKNPLFTKRFYSKSRFKQMFPVSKSRTS